MAGVLDAAELAGRRAAGLHRRIDLLQQRAGHLLFPRDTRRHHRRHVLRFGETEVDPQLSPTAARACRRARCPPSRWRGWQPVVRCRWLRPHQGRHGHPHRPSATLRWEAGLVEDPDCAGPTRVVGRTASLGDQSDIKAAPKAARRHPVKRGADLPDRHEHAQADGSAARARRRRTPRSERRGGPPGQPLEAAATGLDRGRAHLRSHRGSPLGRIGSMEVDRLRRRPERFARRLSPDRGDSAPRGFPITLLVDVGPLYAYVDADDHHHAECLPQPSAGMGPAADDRFCRAGTVACRRVRLHHS